MTSVTSVRYSPDECLSRPETTNKLSTKEPSAVQPQSPLCDLRDLCAMLSPMTSFPPRSQAVHQRAFRSPASIPLCDLRDLCAMLSPMRVFPTQKPSYPPKSLPQPDLNPPSVTSVTSVRCSPRWMSFPPRSQAVRQRALRSPASIPLCDLCDLCDLCAMLSPMRVFLAQEPSCPPEAFRLPASIPSVTSLLL